MIRLMVVIIAVTILQTAADAAFKVQWPKDLPLEVAAKGTWMAFGVILMWAIASQRRHGG